MRLALISDIHGNLAALDAVLADIKRRGVDLIASLGDTATLGPAPVEVLGALAEHADICIMGNHDAYLLEPTLIESYTDVAVIRDSVSWCREELGTSELAIVKRFVPTHRLALPKERELLMFHGSPRNHSENLLDTTPASTLDEALDGHDVTLFAGGHTHLPLHRQHRHKTLLNPGSVGLPFLEPATGGAPTVLACADYAILTATDTSLSVEHIRLELDRSLLRRNAQRPGFPLASALAASYVS